MVIEPLKDDVAEWAAKSWWRGLLACLFRDHVLERRLRQQLKDRSNVWGIGLWPDAAHDLCGAEAIMAIENELGLTIPESVTSNCTFGEMVRQLVALRRKGRKI